MSRSESFRIACGERNAIQNRGRGTVPASILALAELVERPKERPFQASFVTRELAQGVALFGVGVNRASEEDLVPVPLVFSPCKRLGRFRMRGFIRNAG
jgi:hypothetical protein